MPYLSLNTSKSVYSYYCITTLSPGEDVNGSFMIRWIGLLSMIYVCGESLHSTISYLRNVV